MNQVEQKLLDALAVNPVIEHEAFVQDLDHRDKLMLLDTVRDMQKRGVIQRDISEKVDNRRVLKYRLAAPAAPTPATRSGSVNNAPSA